MSMSKLGRTARHTQLVFGYMRSHGSRPFSAAASKKIKMTTEEAFVKVLQKEGIDNAFGSMGSAMPISNLFPAAGVKFWDCALGYSAGIMADGFSRATGKMSMLMAPNGPAMSNYVAPVKTAYLNQTPLLVVTRQEVEQMAMFKDCVCYQEEVRDPSQMTEVLIRCIEKAIQGSAPVQISIPSHMWTKVVEIELPNGVAVERSSSGGGKSVTAADLLSKAAFPGLLNGAGVNLPAHGIDSWPKPLVDINVDHIGLTKAHPDDMSPRQVWKAIRRVLPSEAIISTDIGNDCAMAHASPTRENRFKHSENHLYGPGGYDFPSVLGAKIGNPNAPAVAFAGEEAFGMLMNELTACDQNEWPAITMVVFRNCQLGADDSGMEYARMAEACGLQGVKVETATALEEALTNAVEDQMRLNETTLIEVVVNAKLEESFHRDATTTRADFAEQPHAKAHALF